jgi:hypothetical protein
MMKAKELVEASRDYEKKEYLANAIEDALLEFEDIPGKVCSPGIGIKRMICTGKDNRGERIWEKQRYEFNETSTELLWDEFMLWLRKKAEKLNKEKDAIEIE